MNKRILRAAGACVTTIAIATGIALGGATPAMAVGYTAYCDSVVRSQDFPTTMNAVTVCRIQGGPASEGYFPGKFRYTGTADGSIGINTWKGFQVFLGQYGYNGPIDGVPGKNTYMAMQNYAATAGYSGPIDGDMGANSWSYLNRAMRTSFFAN